MTVDVAVQVFQALLREHRVLASRIARDERGLVWWGSRLAQRFTVSGPVETSAVPTWWLTYETDFLAGFEPGSRAQLATATMLGWSFELFTAGIEQDKVVLRGRTYALEEERVQGPVDGTTELGSADGTAELGSVDRAEMLGSVDRVAKLALTNRAAKLELADRTAELGRRALVASHVAHTYARWYVDGTLALPAAGVRVDTTVHRAPGAEANTEYLPDPAPAPGAILTADALDLTRVTTFLVDRGMTPLEAPPGKYAVGGRLPTSQRDVVVLLDTTATHPHAGPGLSVLFSPVGLANDRAVASAAEINAAVWSTAEPPVGMGTWSGRREIGLSYTNFLPYRWTSPAALRSILADDLGHVLQADRNGWVTPR